MKNSLLKILSIFCLVTTLSSSYILKAQTDFREETIYFLITTRFFDGDPDNNVPTEWSSYNSDPNINPAITDPDDVTWRGDFKGLIQKLDYIKDLGFTAIWITPIVHNRSPLDYHGYHAWDFTKVDPRLESPGATFQDLINEIHARDMKIVLDIVTNHAGRFGIKDVAEIKYNTDPAKPWFTPDNPNWKYDGITTNPEDGLIWSRANLAKMPPPYNQNLAAFNFPSKENYVDTSDPDWYHHSGNGFAQGFDDVENLQNRALAGDTPDLNTGSPVVRDYLINAYTKYINMGVDAFRWDTVKHMSREDIIYFYDAFKAVNPNLFIFGEVAQKRHELHSVEETNPHYYTWRGAVNNSAPLDLAVIDFFGEATFHGTFEEGQSFPTVKAAARYDHLYSDPSTLITWLDNHDFGPNNDWNRRYGGSDENLAACMNFMFTWRGIPTVYYGTEMRFKAGEFNDIHDAAGIRESINKTGRAYYGDVMGQARNHKIYKHLKKLNAMRKAIPALQKGNWAWKEAPGNAVSYRRVYQGSEVAVGLAKDGDASFSISGMTNGLYRDAVTGREITSQNGVLNFTVTSGSAGIYVLNGPGIIGSCGAGFFENCINEPGTPVVIINPTTTNSEDPIRVTLESAGGAGSPYNIYYTTNGTIPTISSTQYSAPFTITESTTINAITYDKEGTASDIVTKNYRVGAIEGLHVYFKKPPTWSQVNVHYWNEFPNVLSTSNWPGPSMNRIDNSDWYVYIFEGVESTSLLFNDQGSTKTDDLTRNRDGWYYNGVWYDSNPEDTPNQDLTIYFKSDSFALPSIYFWQVTPSGLSTAWPGEPMLSDADGWYRYTLSNTTCANLIFSNNGASQTSDLNRCKNGWFYNGTWFDEKPDLLRLNSINPQSSNSIQIYPNPIIENSIIALHTYNEKSQIKIEFINVYGKSKIIFDKKVDKGNHQFELQKNASSLASGIYFCRITIDDTSITKKIIKR
ncbi:alpha-amylase family glycosyl hydrolase [Aquimarina sp. RZ0]|uniref:alpha-amylase family glycosyl hydrolase n=1 Tax=Aquimarina sp. RZ0 TaxID=2607730 RepID=UPI0011F1CF14|nr:alpha-amylase family glycosyl hydrolase [Aquimarina sp. RZ0]KAA1247824.1 starch-binding protein [Aquimarina sp. RZ0]